MERESLARATSRPLRQRLPHDGVLPWAVSSVVTFALDVLEAALLHRDPPAERSRLVTRRFVAGWAKQWFEKGDVNDAGELLCAQIIVCRFGSPTDALFSEADGWNELHAGGAEFLVHHRENDPLRLAIVREDGRTHALSFRSDGDVTISSCASHIEPDLATRATLLLLAAARSKHA